jgi:pimeloyl-ACP methyl ester carboxylesterase
MPLQSDDRSSSPEASAAAFTARRPFIETSDGVRLAYQDWGTGRPIVFLTAWSTNADVWQYTFSDFEERGFRCVSFDRRGHGRSDVAQEGYTIDRLADDVATVIEKLDLHDVTLVGWSLGGAEAIRYLSRRRDRRVSHLVLLAPAAPCLLKTASNPEGLDPVMVQAVRDQWRTDFPRWCEDSAEAFFRPGALNVHRGIVDWMTRMLVATPLDVARRCAQVMADADLREDLRGLELPILHLHGDADASIPVHFGRMCAQIARRARYVELPGAPHGFFFTHRERICSEVREWLATV